MMTQQPRRMMQPPVIDPMEELDPMALRYSKNKLPNVRRGTDLLVVTTYCNNDKWLMLKRAEMMKFLGVRPTHDFILIGDADVADNDLQDMGSIYREVFRNVFTAKLKGQSRGEGWPRGTNAAFRNSVRLMHNQFKTKFDNMPYRGFFYFESDITPLKPDFISLMHELYKNDPHPFMGVVGEIKTKSGVVIRHMNGAAVYPFGEKYFTTDMMLVENAPWDVAGLTGSHFMKMAHDLGHTRYSMHFSTTQYKKLSEGKYSAIKTPHGAEPFGVTCDIFPTHLIHHGCKDASLMDLLMGKVEDKKPDIITTAPKIGRVDTTIPKNLWPKKKRRAKKSPKKKAAKEVAVASSPEAIRAAHKGGMKWKELIKTFRVMPKELKKILEG